MFLVVFALELSLKSIHCFIHTRIYPKAGEGAYDGGWANLSGIDSRIHGVASDFDASNYGCSNLSSLVEKSGGFEIRKDEGAVYLRRKVKGRKTVTTAKGTRA